MANEYRLSFTAEQINTKLGKIDSLAEKSQIPTKTSQLSNDSGFITASDIPEDKPTIIDVLELPTENIDEDCFYRKLSGNLILNQSIVNAYTVYCVETLPETGEPGTNIEQTQGTIYYDRSTNECYAYVDSALSAAMSVPTGWYTGATLLGAIGEEYAGTITNILDDPMDGKFRMLFEYVMYSYKDGWTCHKYIGWSGTGAGAEVFNHPSNIASGYASHAEGEQTTASGAYSHAEGFSTEASNYYSHAEGEYTIASGQDSHAEGFSTTASGTSSHAEGHSTTASGAYSHAEGNDTEASGYYSHAEGHKSTASGAYSHAEGYNTIASGSNQHVQGKYNIEDTEDKYAHIVGNGTSDNKRSNAHTIDWNGIAWFAGDVYIGGTSQDVLSERLATENFVADSISAASSVINVLGDLSEDTKVTLKYEGNRVSEALFMRFLSMVAEDDSRYICIIRMMTPMESSNKIVLHSFLMSEMGVDGDGTYVLFKTYNEDNMLTIRFYAIDEPSEENPVVGTFNMIPFNSASDSNGVIPEYTEEDEGKFLRIVNGVPTWVSIPNAEEATF